MASTFQILQNIRKLREFRNLNQEQLADILELSTRGYRNLETGESKLCLDRFLAIAQALQITPEKLMSLHQVEQPAPAAPISKQEILNSAAINRNPAIDEDLSSQLAWLKKEIDSLKVQLRG